MLCISITGPDLIEASHQVKDALFHADLLEFRLDLFASYDMKKLLELKKTIPLPMIFTLRKKEQGGHYEGSEQERLQHLRLLATLSPTYLDLEDDVDPLFVKQLACDFPDIKLIISHHNFTHTPLDLEVILTRMSQLPAHLYKIACMATSTNDSLRMLNFVRQHAPILGMCMGEKGELTRILGPILGAPWTFAYLHQKTAEGQLSAKELRTIYHISNLDQTTSIYGLIGNPVTTSLSQFTHNQVMHELHLHAVYVKMAVEIEELDTFFALAKQLGIRGLSVTMPLKEYVLPFLDHIDAEAKKIGAVNTIIIKEDKLTGYNTDGKGAFDAIEKNSSILNKNILLLGAGGAARALIYEALKRGGKVCILNRTQEKAHCLADEFGIQGGSLEQISNYAYDILINTTPHSLPISATAICPHTVVMDIKTHPKMTAFLQHASEKNCTLVFGYEMFINQAAEQYKIWFDAKLSSEKILKILQKEVLKHLEAT